MSLDRKLTASMAVLLATAVACGGSNSSSKAPPTFKISGTITGAGGPGATVTLSTTATTATVTATADGTGAYSFNNVPNGSYTVTPAVAAIYTCSPASRDVTVNGADVAVPDFTSALKTYAISGTVTGATGVTIDLTGPSYAGSTTTDGDYSFPGLLPGDYTITPSKAGYIFSPDHIDVTITAGDQAVGDIVATITHAVYGTVVDSSPTPLAGVSMILTSLTTPAQYISTTDVAGNYAFAQVVPGDYTLVPLLAQYTFVPGSRTVHVDGVTGSDVVVEAFMAITYTVSGTVTDGANPVANVSVTLSDQGGPRASATTGATGAFSFGGLLQGNYTLAPSTSGYTYQPDHIDFSVLAADVPNQDFTATLITYTVSGVITDTDHVTPLSTVTVRLTGTGATNGAAYDLTNGPDGTGTDGSYTFTVQAGTYTVSPTLNGKAFFPASATVAVAAGNVTQDFHVGSWVRQNPLPTGSSLFGLWASSATDMWAVGSSGTILHGNGSIWSAVPSGTTQDLIGVWGSSASDVWTAGASGAVLHWDGAAWSPVGNGSTAVVLKSAWGIGSDIWAAGYSTPDYLGVVLRWDGNAWTTAASGVGNLLNSIWGSSTTDVWAVGQVGRVIHWDGASWTDVTATIGATSNVVNLWGTGPDDVWIVGDRTLRHKDPTGWHDMLPEFVASTANLSAVWGSGGDVWVYGSVLVHEGLREGFVYRRAGTTGTWTTSATVTSPVQLINSFWGADGANIWAVGNSGTMLRTIDGEAWTNVSSVATGDLKDVWASSPDDAWAVGKNETILRYTNGAWTKVPMPTLTRPPVYVVHLYSVWGSSANDVWIVGAVDEGTSVQQGKYGLILHWDGTQFQDHSFSGGGQVQVAGEILTSIRGTDANHVWAVGTVSAPKFWNGQSWSGAGTPPEWGNLVFPFVWPSSSSDVWFCGGRNTGVVHYTESGGWVRLNVTGNPKSFYAWGSDPSNVWFLTGTSSATNGMAHWDGSSLTVAAGAPVSNSVWGTSASDVWAGSTGGVARHWNGAQWDAVPWPGSSSRSVVFGGSGAGGTWAVSTAGSIFHWE